MVYEFEKRQLRALDRKHKLGVIRVLKAEELQLLARLYHHSKTHAIHSFNVCADCIYVGEKLGLSREQLDRLKIAALLHDVGKLDMELIILDQGVSAEEQLKILRFLGKEPSGNPMKQITLKDLIEYRSSLWFFRNKKISSGHKRVLLNRLGKEADVTLLQHIRNHQKFTEERLLKAGTEAEIVEYASRHHPEYLAKPGSKLQISILSVVDKFNAMIQSEGVRNYHRKLGRIEALDLLVEKFKEPKFVIKALAEKYVPMEEDELLSIHGSMVLAFGKNLLVRILAYLKIANLLGVGRKRKQIEKLKEKLEIAYQRG